MRDAIHSDEKTKDLQEVAGGLRIGLRVKRYEPCFVEDRQQIFLKRRKNTSRRDKGEIERIVREVYGEYERMVSVKSGRNLAVCTTEYYTEALCRYMAVALEPIVEYCREIGQTGFCEWMPKFVSESEHFLMQGLREELKENAARYALRPVSYYVHLARIRLAHLNGERKRERTVRAEDHQKTEVLLYEVCEDLIVDCRERLHLFSKKAQHRYDSYMDVLFLCLENRKINLPEYADGEEWAVFCHALERRGKALSKNREEGMIWAERKYADYEPCTCGREACKTWATGDEADYEISKWYGMWYGEEGECFEFTEETIGGRAYCVKRCYMDMLPRGKRTHIEFWCEDDPEELWTMHIGKNLLGLTGEEAALYYVILENMEHQILRLYCEDERVFLYEDDSICHSGMVG